MVEYLVKNGADRVVDNVKDHVYEIKVLTSFQFIDEKGKDQGINIRHRAKEITELINDPDRLKDEREKARVNKNKYTGVAAEEVKYGGFGSDSYRGSSSSTAANTSSNNNSTTAARDSYDNAATAASQARRGSSEKSAPSSNMPTLKMADAPVSASKPAQKAAASNLLDIDFSAPVAPANDGGWGAFTSSTVAAPAASNDGFADFQSAPVATSHNSGYADFSGFQSAPAQPANNNNFGFKAASSTGNFDAFQSATGSSAFGNNTSSSWSTAPMSASGSNNTQLKPMSAASNSNAFSGLGAMPVKKNATDILQSNLAALDTLSKYNIGAAKASPPAPALNQLTNTSSPAVSNQNQGWGAFTAAPTTQQKPATNQYSGFDDLLL